MLNTKKLSSIISLITILAVFMPQEVHSEDILVQDNFDSTFICLKNGDKNKGHGNDPYIEFVMNIKEIGTAKISGDFDLDNPGASMDKQMKIIAGDEKIQWTGLNELQKQQIKDEWARQVCLLSLYAD